MKTILALLLIILIPFYSQGETMLRGMGFYLNVDSGTLKTHVDKIKRYNGNHIRLIFLPKNHTGHSDYIYDLYRQIQIALPVVEYARAKGVSVVIDLHWTPGGTGRYRRQRNSSIYYNKGDRQVFIDSMHNLFHTFKSFSNVWGYDYNEPIYSRLKQRLHNRMMRGLLQALKAISPEKKLIIETMAGYRNNHIKYFKRFDNAVYSFHYYYPEKGADDVTGKVYTKTFENCKKAVSKIREFQKRYNAEIYVGEYGKHYYNGVDVPQENRLLFLDHFHKLAKRYKWHTVYHWGHQFHPFALSTPFGTCNNTGYAGWCNSNVINESNEASLRLKYFNASL